MIKDVIAILEDIKAQDFELDWSNIMILEEIKVQDFKLDWSSIQAEKVSITFTRKTDFVSFLRQYHFSYNKSHIKQICTKEFKVVLEHD